MIEFRNSRPTPEEIKRLVGWLNDPALMKYSEQRHAEHTVDTQYNYLYDRGYSPQIYERIYLDNVMIGTITADLDGKNYVADVGILIGAQHIGKGHGYSAWRLFCDGLSKKGVRKIEGGCMAQNKAMIRLFEKSGMRLEGTRRYHFQIGKNKFDDMVLYGRLA